MGAGLAHRRHHVVAIDEQRRVVLTAQRNVQHRPALGDVDRLAGEHPIAKRLDPGHPGQLDQQPNRLFGDALLRAVDEQIAEPVREPVEPRRVVCEQRPQRHVAQPIAMFLQPPPHLEGPQSHDSGECTRRSGPVASRSEVATA
jgi:hypothetical protein